MKTSSLSNAIGKQAMQTVPTPAGSIAQYLSLLDEQIVRLNDAIVSLGSRLQPLSVAPSGVPEAAQNVPVEASEVALRVYSACVKLEGATGLIDDIRRRIDY